jgi:hypothetical protein
MGSAAWVQPGWSRVTTLNLDLGRWIWWPGRLSGQPDDETATAGREAEPGPLTGRRGGGLRRTGESERGR